MKSSLHHLLSSRRSSIATVLAIALAMGGAFVVDAAAAREAPGAHRFGGGAGRGMAFAGARQAERVQQQQQRAMQRQAQQQAAQRPAETQAAPVHNEVPAEPAQERGRPGRLTPEERRALRQQINDASRDIYRPGRP